jgi:two-component system response regulator YesN
VYRLLVVDDETNIREGMANAVPWERHGVRLVGQAADGGEALARCRELAPDIVITDIRMDGLGGLDFAARLREERPEVRIVFVTGYDTFEYAQRAVDLRASAFLVKPVLPEELAAAVRRIVEELDEARRVREKIENFDRLLEAHRGPLEEHLATDLLEGRVAGREELERRRQFLGPTLEGPAFAAAVFAFDDRAALASLGSRELHGRLAALREIAAGHLGGRWEAHTVFLSDHTVAAVISGDFGASHKGRQRLHRQLEIARDAAAANLGSTVTVGCGGVVTDVLLVHRSYAEAVRCLEFRAASGPSSLITADDAAAMDGAAPVYPWEAEVETSTAIAEEDAERAARGIAGFCGELARLRLDDRRLQRVLGQLTAAVARQFMAKGVDLHETAAAGALDPRELLDREGSLEGVCHRLAELVRGSLGELGSRRQRSVRRVVELAREYLGRNYARADLSLVGVAESLGLSPAYFSRLFHRETGESYVDHVIGLRIAEAKRLLRITAARVADVGATVGYQNPQYFCTIFRRIVGSSPAEYREHAREAS